MIITQFMKELSLKQRRCVSVYVYCTPAFHQELVKKRIVNEDLRKYYIDSDSSPMLGVIFYKVDAKGHPPYRMIGTEEL